jgi:hypothetical protein
MKFHFTAKDQGYPVKRHGSEREVDMPLLIAGKGEKCGHTKHAI